MNEDVCKFGDLSEDLRKGSEVVMAVVQNYGDMDLIYESLREEGDILNILG